MVGDECGNRMQNALYIYVFVEVEVDICLSQH